MTTAAYLTSLRAAFGSQLQENVPLAKYTSARIGGPADVLLAPASADELARVVGQLWELHVPFMVMGGGSNMLVSDAGVRGVVVLNKARKVVFDDAVPSVWAESGAGFGAIARQAARKSLSGLEWAAGIPGTVGGAVVGNAGAHGGDVASDLILAEVLQQRSGREEWSTEELDFQYRSSVLKRNPGQAVVLAAAFRLAHSEPELIKEKMDEFLAFRRRTQPPGASMGSMFKNPPGDYAGRLIEASGLKGTRLGEAGISDLHANFFVNYGGATARQVVQLIQTAQQTVKDKFDVALELEIELVGEWDRSHE